MPEQQLQTIMTLIATAGNAKSLAVEAVMNAKKGNFNKASQLIEEAENTMLEAHKIQTNMLTQEAQGEDFTITLLTIHSQDHLMNAITYIDLAKEIIELHQLIKE